MIIYYILLGIAVLVMGCAAIYFGLCFVHVARHRRVAVLLKELLETTEWSSIMELIKDEEYVQAVVDACGMMLED